MSILDFFKLKRVFTATIFIAIMIVTTLLGGVVWSALIYTLIFLGTSELIKLLNSKGIYPLRGLVMFFNLLLVILAYFDKPEYFIHVIIFAFIIVFVTFLFQKRKISVNDVATTIFSIIYTGLLPAHFILIRNIKIIGSQQSIIELSMGYLLLVLMVIWTSDIAAYYVGKNFGKKLLCPDISPKKTIEGAIGGTLFGIIMSISMGFLINLNLIHSTILGLIIVILAQLGDLCESLIKRDADVKDSGNILPGHGGILDRADSYVFSAPAAYYYIKFVILSGLGLFI